MIERTFEYLVDSFEVPLSCIIQGLLTELEVLPLVHLSASFTGKVLVSLMLSRKASFLFLLLINGEQLNLDNKKLV